MSEQDPLEGIVELSLTPDDARVVLDLMAKVWDEGKWAAYNAERDGDDGSEVPNPYRSDATAAPLAGEQDADGPEGHRDDNDAQGANHG